MRATIDLDKLRFSQRQRLTFIESVAYWEGAVDRPRVSSAFDVSENHVTKDFRLYKDACPGNLQYDESARVYRPTRRFRPRIGKGSAEEYLSLLRSYAEHQTSVVVPTLGSVVPAASVPQPKGRLDASTLNAVTRAISGATGLAIAYQSLNNADPSARRVWPHALLFSGTRWHARAYDEQRVAFIDLVLQRILSVKPVDEESPQAPSRDTEWTQVVELEVVPSRGLTPGQAAVVAQEFGMSKVGRDWVWKVRLRECLAGYFIYLYRLDLSSDPQRLIELRDPSVASRYRFAAPSRDGGSAEAVKDTG